MEKTKLGQKIIWVLKSVLASYIVTGVLLLAITFLVYKFQIAEDFVDTGIVATYLLSTFIGGFIIGKLIGHRKFLWGILVGLLYVGLLYAISYAMWGKLSVGETEDLVQIALCIGGGMFGGMLA